jgi:DNA repair protein RecN (Recombination protein N)
VLVITHSPQVAALGDQHLQVLKTVRGDQTTTHVSELNHDECLEEVARMLSGSEITSEARAQAKQLMVA